MPWWLEENPPPSYVRTTWLRNTRFLYRGSRSWLVTLNLGISCLTLIPYFLFFVVWLFKKYPIFGGDEDILVGGFAYFFLGATSEIPYSVCIVPALLAGWVLFLREIPIRVRWITATIQLVAWALFAWILHLLKIGFQNGPFGKP